MLGDETVTRIIQKALKGYVFSAEDRHKCAGRNLVLLAGSLLPFGAAF